jgi:hypothetical protein
MTERDDLRVGDAERTRVTEALHEHFAQGRLTRDELDERLDTALAAKTYGDLRRVTQDLPAPGPATEPWASSTTAGAAGPPSAAMWSGHVPPIAWRRPRFPFFGLLAVIFIVALVSGGPGLALVGVFKVVLVIWLVLAVVGLLHVRRWRRYGRRSRGRYEYGPGGAYRGDWGPRQDRRTPGPYRPRGRRRW